jgi:UDP-N-acetylmuramate--alanine ligase
MEGVQRRLEVKGEKNGILVIDDYGHHPTEIKTTLQALGSCWPDKRKAVVFQPHRYSRTKALFDDFVRSFYQSDILVILPVYAAGEQPILGIGGQSLCEAVRSHGHKDVVYKNGIKEAVSYLREKLEANDLLLTLGAGDVWKTGEEFLAN